MSGSGEATGDIHPALMRAEAGGQGAGNSRSLISTRRGPQLEGSLLSLAIWSLQGQEPAQAKSC